LVVECSFQGIDCIGLYIYWEKLDVKVLIEVSPALNEEDSGIHFLLKEVFEPLCSLTFFEDITNGHLLICDWLI